MQASLFVLFSSRDAAIFADPPFSLAQMGSPNYVSSQQIPIPSQSHAMQMSDRKHSRVSEKTTTLMHLWYQCVKTLMLQSKAGKIGGSTPDAIHSLQKAK
jgi:hypothetical protein